jgi:hypothetical protein
MLELYVREMISVIRLVPTSPPDKSERPSAMRWHIWLFRFLLAWNVLLLTALIVMVIG